MYGNISLPIRWWGPQLMTVGWFAPPKCGPRITWLLYKTGTWNCGTCTISTGCNVLLSSLSYLWSVLEVSHVAVVRFRNCHKCKVEANPMHYHCAACMVLECVCYGVLPCCACGVTSVVVMTWWNMIPAILTTVNPWFILCDMPVEKLTWASEYYWSEGNKRRTQVMTVPVWKLWAYCEIKSDKTEASSASFS